MFTLDVYQKLAQQTAKYPQETGVVYSVLGLAGEAGELVNKIQKFMRQGKDLQDLSPEDKSILLDELGDVLWYCSALAHELETPLSYPAMANIRKLAKREKQDDILSLEHGQGGQ